MQAALEHDRAFARGRHTADFTMLAAVARAHRLTSGMPT